MKRPSLKRPATPGSPVYRRRLSPPSNVMDTLLGISVQFCKKYLFININSKLIVYTTLIVIGSLLAPFLPLPTDLYIVQKGNFFNQYFVKLGWAWTFTIVGAFVYLTSSVYCAANAAHVLKHCSRLIIGTILWYVVTDGFVSIERSSGSCSIVGNTDYHECVASGGKWKIGFDISGHTFLLLFCCLLIREEAKVMAHWDRMRHLLETEGAPELALMNSMEIATARDLHQKYTRYIKGLFIAMSLLHFLWELMLIVTTLYYHTFLHKVTAMCFAYACWYVTYRGWYFMAFPGLPGNCKFKYLTWNAH